MSMSWLFFLAVSLFAATIDALIISPREQAATFGEATNNSRADNSSTLGLQLPPTGSAFLNATGTIDDPRCNEYQAASIMPVSSCQDALSQIPDTTSAISGPNGAPLYYPYRVSSSDGTCTINIASNQQEIRVSGRVIRQHATSIVEHCVQGRNNPWGGNTQIGGTDENRVVIALHYYPGFQNVHCLPGPQTALRPPPPPSNCAETLQKMGRGLSTKQYQLSEPQPVPAGMSEEVETPAMVVDSKLNCMLIIDLMQDHFVLASDRDVSDAAVAVDAMCVRRGLAGWATDIGMRSFLRDNLKLSVLLENGHQSGSSPNGVLALPGVVGNVTAL